MEVVNDFNYLGTVFNYTGNFSLNQQQLVCKGLNALNVWLINCRQYKLKPRILCKLFDSFISSIINYACDISGFSKWKEIERIHLKFCKKILMYKMNIPTTAVFGEFGRYPLYIPRYVRIFKYWFRLIQTDYSIMQKLFTRFHIKIVFGEEQLGV